MWQQKKKGTFSDARQIHISGENLFRINVNKMQAQIARSCYDVAIYR